MRRWTKGRLVSEEGSHGHGGGHDGKGQVDGLGAVAAVLLTLANVGVVLLEDGLKNIVKSSRPGFNFMRLKTRGKLHLGNSS